MLEAMGFISHYLDVTEIDSIIKLKKTLKVTKAAAEVQAIFVNLRFISKAFIFP